MGDDILDMANKVKDAETKEARKKRLADPAHHIPAYIGEGEGDKKKKSSKKEGESDDGKT